MCCMIKFQCWQWPYVTSRMIHMEHAVIRYWWVERRCDRMFLKTRSKGHMRSRNAMRAFLTIFEQIFKYYILSIFDMLHVWYHNHEESWFPVYEVIKECKWTNMNESLRYHLLHTTRLSEKCSIHRNLNGLCTSVSLNRHVFTSPRFYSSLVHVQTSRMSEFHFWSVQGQIVPKIVFLSVINCNKRNQTISKRCKEPKFCFKTSQIRIRSEFWLLIAVTATSRIYCSSITSRCDRWEQSSQHYQCSKCVVW